MSHIIVRCWTLLILTIAIGMSGEARATERLALLIGVSDYPDAPLTNPVKDIALVGKSLEGSAFKVTSLPNPDHGQMEAAIYNFADKVAALRTGSTVFFYFSGHGFQANGANWLMPSRSQIRFQSDIRNKSVETQWALNLIAERAVEGVEIVFVIDACRNAPPISLGQQKSGLASVEKPKNRDIMLAFSASPGETASDGAGNRGGPYATALAAALATDDITVSEVFMRVEQSFRGQKLAQNPYTNGSNGTRLRLRKDNPSDVATALRAAQGDYSGVASQDAGPTRQKGAAARTSQPDNSFTDIARCAEIVAPIGQAALEQRALAQMNAIDLLCAGWPYVDGDKKAGIEQNFERAIRFMRHAAARGNSAAVNTLGLLLCCRNGGPKNEAEGYEWFRVAESLGSVRALLNIGVNYRDGLVVKQDFGEAERLFTLTTQRGDPRGWRYLGHLYNDAKFPRADKVKGRDFFRQAFEGDPATADNVLDYASILRWGIAPDGGDKDPQAALNVYLAGAANGCVPCWSEAGKIVDDASTGLADIDMARAFYRAGDAAGDAESSHQMGQLLTRDRSKPGFDPENFKRAFAAHSRAASLGNVESQVRIAIALARGEGVARDPVSAEPRLHALLARDNSADPAERHAIYAPNYWGMGLELGNLIEDGLVKPRVPDELAALRARYGVRKDSMKRFTVPIMCAAVRSPFDVYVVNWDRPNDETSVDSQAEWLKQARGCTIPPDVLTSFTKLKAIARENKVAFTDLTVYALGAAAQTNKPSDASKPQKEAATPK